MGDGNDKTECNIGNPVDNVHPRRALLQEGNLGMRISDYTSAKRDFQSALDLPGISAQLRGAAKNGLEFADSFEKLRRK